MPFQRLPESPSALDADQDAGRPFEHDSGSISATQVYDEKRVRHAAAPGLDTTLFAGLQQDDFVDSAFEEFIQYSTNDLHVAAGGPVQGTVPGTPFSGHGSMNHLNWDNMPYTRLGNINVFTGQLVDPAFELSQSILDPALALPALPDDDEASEHDNEEQTATREVYRAATIAQDPLLNQAERLQKLCDLPVDDIDAIWQEMLPATPQRSSQATISVDPSPAQDPLQAQAPTFAVQPFLAPPTGPAFHPSLSEQTYLPIYPDDTPAPDPNARRPIYPVYSGSFRTSQQARLHRKRVRVGPKDQAPDVERVRRFGRQYWVQRLYNAMIDVSAISDGESSIHRQRFVDTAAFDALDLEACAHHVFDSALAVHERGWNRSNVYHKKVVRGKLTDVSEKSVEQRLARICLCLRQRKATVDDAMRGGITLALLCDNPEARGFTKMSNNTGNKKRGERLRLVKTKTKAKARPVEQTEQAQEQKQEQGQEQGQEQEQEQEEKIEVGDGSNADDA
ncbi:hypothetical protein ACN47E_000408 [Coniothyrium glycines]